MPAQQRGRRAHQLAGLEVAAEGGQDQPIGWEEVGPFDLAAQNGDLVSECQNLKLQFCGGAALESDGAHDQPHHRIKHERGPYSSCRPAVVARQPTGPALRPNCCAEAGVKSQSNSRAPHPRQAVA